MNLYLTVNFFLFGLHLGEERSLGYTAFTIQHRIQYPTSRPVVIAQGVMVASNDEFRTVFIM